MLFVSVCVLAPFPHTHFPAPASLLAGVCLTSELELAGGKMGNDQRQIAAPTTDRRAQVEGEVPSALTGGAGG